MIKSKSELFYMRDHATPNGLTWGQAIDLGVVSEKDYEEAVWAYLDIDAPPQLRAWWMSWAPIVSDNPSLPALVHQDARKKLQERARDVMNDVQAMRHVRFDEGGDA